MKKCIIMFVFFVIMIVIAAVTDSNNAIISENDAVEYADVEIVAANNEQ